MRFLLLLIACGCARLNNYNELGYDEQIAYQIMYQFASDMEQSGLKMYSVGLESKNGKMNCLAIGFKIDEQLTFDSARDLSVKSVDRLLRYINCRSELAGYLTEFPCSGKNVKITIIGRDNENNNSNWVDNVIVHESICYFSGNLSDPNIGLLREETFEEAVTILQRQEENGATPSLK